MSSLGTQHPEDGILLRYIDGELPGRKGRQVQSHLKACWQCRTEVEELEQTVASCVRYRRNVLQAYLPDPPNPWPDLYREFARIDSSSSGKSHLVVKQLAARFVALVERAMVRQWALGAVAAVAMVCVVWYQFRETPSVQAAALLKRAVLAAGTQATPTQRVIQVRTRTQKFTRTVGRRRLAAAETPSAAIAAPLQEKLRAARFDSEDPLSARWFQAWRESAEVQKDEVTATPEAYRIRTVALGGELASASLTLRSGDLMPMEERLEFRDEEWIEFTDITDATTRDDGAPVATNVELPVRPAVPSRLAVTSGPASISDELQVLSALHEIGADLGDPVEVKLSGGQVTVGGVGISPARQRQIRERMNGMANVSVQFSDAAAGAVPEEAAATDAVGPGVTPAGFQARVEKQLGGHAEFEKFSGQVLDRNESLMSRAYALRRLAERFSKDREDGLAAGDREVLRTMARQHATALATEVAAIDRSLRPLLVSMSGSAGGPAASRKPSYTAWQPATEELLQASHRVEVLVSVLLGLTPGTAATERLPSDLLAAMADLRANLDSAQRLLAQ